MTRELPPFLRDLLANPPRAGEGIHNYLFRASRQLHAHLPAGEIFQLLKTAVARCGRNVPDSEIWDAIRNSLGCAWHPRGGSSAFRPISSKWPTADLKRIEAICAEGAGLADLWEASPTRINDNRVRTEELIDRLFPGNLLLCCGRSQSDFDTKPREQWHGELAKLQFIVPSPMSALRGRKKNPQPGEDELSAHTLDNTGPRRFLVVECDFSIFDRSGKKETIYAPLIRKLDAQGFTVADMCAAVLLHLAGYAPMVLALHSGGKSMHGWFYVHGQPEDKVLRFFRYAVSLGADPATWTRSQFVRMPDGTRDNGKLQTVFFYHPHLLEAK